MYPYDDKDENGNPIQPVSTSSLRVLTLSDQIRQDKELDIDWADRANIAFKAGLYGMANNLIDLGKWTGIANEDTELYDVKQILSDEKYDLGLEYASSSNLYDLAGDIGFGLVTGGAAMWGLKALKSVNIVGKSVAGMMNFGGARADAARDAMKIAYETAASADDVRKFRSTVWGYSAAQEAFDGAVISAATELTLNAGSELNKEGVDTATALGHIGTSIAFGAGFQGLLGGAFGSLSRLGETKAALSVVKDSELAASYGGYVSKGAGYEGDDVAKVIGEINRLQGIAPISKAQEIARETALAQADTVLTDAIYKATKDVTHRYGFQELNPVRSAFTKMAESPEGRDTLSKVLQNSVGGVRVPTAADFVNNSRLASLADKEGKLLSESADKGIISSNDLSGVDFAEYKRLVDKAEAHETLSPLDVDSWITLRGKSEYVKAKANPKFQKELDDLYEDLEIPKGNELDEFAALKTVYDTRSERGYKAFSKKYPTLGGMMEQMGSDNATQIFGVKSTIFLDTTTQTAHEAPAHLLANVTDWRLEKGAITFKPLTGFGAQSVKVTAPKFGAAPDMDLLKFQAQRVLVSGKPNVSWNSDLVSRIEKGDTLNFNEWSFIEREILGGRGTSRGTDNIGADTFAPASNGNYTFGRYNVDAAALHEGLAKHKSELFNGIINANKDARASDVARAIGVSEKFVLSRGLYGDVKLATGDAYRVTLGDMVGSVDDITKRSAFAIDYAMPNMTVQSNADIYAHMASESAKQSAKIRDDMMRIHPELVETFRSSLPLEDVSGFGTRRFWSNAAQIGGYQGLVAAASELNDNVQKAVRNAFTRGMNEVQPTGAALLANKEASAEYAAHIEWYSQKGEGLISWGADHVVTASAAKELIDAGYEVGDSNAIRALGVEDLWTWKTPQAKDFAASMQGIIKRDVTKPKSYQYAAMGRTLDIDANAYYLPPRTYEHMTFIVERNANPLSDQSKNVYKIVGDSAEDLRRKVQTELAKASGEGRRVFEAPPTSVDEYKSAQRIYEWAGDARKDQIRSSGAQSDLKKSGQRPDLYPEVDTKKLIEDQAAWYRRQLESSHGNTVELYYGEEFRLMREMQRQADGVQSTDLGMSRMAQVLYGDGVAKDRKASDWEQVMTMAKGGDTGNLNLWGSVNNFVEDMGAGVGTKIRESWVGIKRLRKSYRDGEAASLKAWDDEAEAVRQRLADAGINLTAGNYVASRAARETRLDAQDFRGFIGTANMLQATMLFRLDYADIAVNVMSSVVKAGGELQALKAIAKANGTESALAAESKALFGAGATKGVRSDGAENVINQWSTAKALAEGFKFVFSKDRAAKIEEWVEKGLMMDTHGLTSAAYDAQILDLSAIHTSEAAKEAASKYRTAGKKFIDTLAKPTDWTNLVIQGSMLHIAERLGTSAGLKGAELTSFMRTFNRRVNAVTNPSQKPRLFQGGVGMALGLYQSYQFHMLNNMFRYASGGVKSAPSLVAALNAGFFGVQSIPGFQQLNSMIAERNGAEGHTDMYGALAKVLGSEADGRDMFDFMVYGAGSWAMQNNLFVRGDMNPRNVTIVPTSFADIPTVQAFSRLVDAGVDTIDKIAHGGSVISSPLDAIVGLGYSRPLRGLYETVKGRSVDGTASTVVYHDDIESMATVNRLLGARPLDEAIVRDYQSRFYANKAAEVEAKKALSKYIKRSYAENPDSINDPENIARWQSLYENANGSVKNWEGYMRDQVTKVDDDLSQRLEDSVKNSPDALAQYRAILGY